MIRSKLALAGATLLFSYLLVTAHGSDERGNPLINQKPTTFCNPLNLDYKIQPDHEKGYYREAADPVALFYKGNYYIFASKSGGYWMSPDFVNWKLVTPPNLPLDRWAPAVFEYKGALYFMTTGDGKIYRSETPEKADSWTVEGKVRGDQDPDLFLDDDGRGYLYYGCHPGGPISGVELDPANHFAEIGKPVDLLKQDSDERGWERNGEKHDGLRVYIEGSWMTKHDSKYYLQYAAPGTQLKCYSDGCAVSDKPLGPFTYASNSPISSKPDGFLGSAGHSAVFTDATGNLWRIVTAVVGVKHSFERRLALYPQGFDKEGRMFTRTVLGDYPQYLPGSRPHPEQGNSPGWMLLSYGKPATASSSLTGHPPGNAVDENIKTWWSAAESKSGEWLQIDLGQPKSLQAVQINFAEEGITGQNRTNDFAQRYLLDSSLDRKSWSILVDKRGNTNDIPHDYLELKNSLSARFVRITDAGTPSGGNFSLRGLRLFGNGDGKAPVAVDHLTIERKAESRREALLSWSAVPEAEGYIIRYGVAPDALWNQFQMRGTNSLRITSLNATPGYWFTVDSFNENGVTPMAGNAIPAP